MTPSYLAIHRCRKRSRSEPQRLVSQYSDGSAIRYAMPHLDRTINSELIPFPFPSFPTQSIAPGIVKTQARIKQSDRKTAANDSPSPAGHGADSGTDIRLCLFDSEDATYPSEVALNHLLEVFITHFVSPSSETTCPN